MKQEDNSPKKKQIKTPIIFLCGLLLGILVMGGIMWLSASKSKAPASKNATEAISETEHSQDVEESDGSVDTAANTWNAETVYVGGDEVAYNGKIYRAKWWTQGEEPGKADVWEDTLIAAGSTTDAKENTTTKKEPRPEVGKRDDFKVVGYFASWASDTSKIQYDVMTHINYAFAIPTAEGGLRPLENEQLAKQVIKEAHENDVKVFLAVGGWSYNDVPLEATFVSATETKEKREAFVDEIMNMCDTYGFDGIDIDWEHPRIDGKTYQQYEALLEDLAERLHAEDKQLSSAVISGVTADGNVYYDAASQTDKVLDTVDWINVMAYDGGDGERHSSYEFAVNCADYWTNSRGLSADKVILGVPFYARPSWADYADILAQVPDAWDHDHVSYNGMDVWYNGVETIEKKTEYALENLGGIMIWELSQDSSDEHSLQTAIGKTVKK